MEAEQPRGVYNADDNDDDIAHEGGKIDKRNGGSDGGKNTY
jgi:hypothetical protein